MVPVVLFDSAYWKKAVGFEAMVEAGVIAASDLDLFHFADSAEDAWQHLFTVQNAAPV